MATILAYPGPERSATMRPQQVEQTTGDGDANASVADSGARWRAWMVRAQAGDQAAYHALLVDIAPYLRAIANRYLGHGEDAEDATQEILMVVHDIRHTYEPSRPFKPWLSTIASRRCIDLLRRRMRRRQRETTGDELDQLPDAGSGPEARLAGLQASRTLRDAVDTLSPKQREAVALLHLQELTLGEAASESGQTTGALKVACHRALKTLRQSLRGQGLPRD
jgi:RNA polymerase sigma-70 factor (ECF subfamily)